MDPKRWEHLKEIFSRALELPAEARSAFLAEACGGDSELKSEAARLLADHESAGVYLSRPVIDLSPGMEPEAEPRFTPGTVLARRFQIRRFIARGGMGEVYEADDLELSEPVAIKTVRAGIAANERMLELFKKEIQLARRVTHPNVCRTFDFFQHRDDAGEIINFLSMELLSGPTLAQHLNEGKTFSPAAALPLIDQMACALQAAHDAGIIHRDFKPGNVMLVTHPDGAMRVAVTDFGMAFSPPHTGAASPSIAGGTPAYMAPEQLEGGEIVPATDVYAFGLVIAEMLGARPASGKKSGLSRTLLKGSGTPSRHAIRLPRAHVRWQRIIERCLAAQPSDRFARPAEVASALRQAMEPTRPLGSRRMLAWVVAMAVLAIGGWLAVSLWRSGAPGQGVNSEESFKRQIPLPRADISLWKVSPNGKSMILTDNNASGSNLVLWDLQTGRLRPVTRAGLSAAGSRLDAEYPVFSPDGERIVYAMGAGEIRMVRIDSSEDHVLYSAPDIRVVPQDWSPDGERILAGAIREGVFTTLILSARDGSILYSVPHRSRNVPVALFYRDGSRVIYNIFPSEGDFRADIEMLDPATGRQEPLVRSPADDRIVGWTTNLNQFLFSSNRGGTNGLWALPFSKQGAAGEPRELKSDMEGMQPLGLTSSGSLFYSVIRPDINVWTAEIDVEAARTISGPRRASLKFRGVQNYASWSHDGSKLAVCLLGSLAVWSRDKDEVHSLEVKGIFFSSPQWLGTSGWLIAFGSKANGKQGYYRINSTNGEAQLAFDSSAINSNGFAGVWTHDGTIHFNRYSGGQSGLFRLNVVTGERRSLYVPPSGSNLGREALALSPDERWLAFQLFHTDSKISNLMLIPSEGGEARTLWNIDGAYFFSNGAFTWSRDGHYVIAARERNRISEIWRIPLDGSAPRKVEFPDTKRLMTLRMNPDGKTIAFVAGDLPKPELWVLENFLAR